MSCDNVPTTAEIGQAKKNVTDFNTFMTSTSDTFTDSKGVSRLTLQGAVNKFGFGIAPFTFTEGGTLLDRKLLVSNDPVDGFLYRYVGTGDFHITVTAGTDPTSGTDWEAFTATSAEFISNANGGSVQDFIDAKTFNNVADMLNFDRLKIGEIYSTGGTLWQYMGGSPVDIQKFKPLTVIVVTDFGAKGDGITDDTVACQAALDSGEWVAFPSGVYMIKAHTESGTGLGGLKINSGNKLIAVGDVTFKAIPNSAGTYSVLDMTNVSGVSLYDLKILGDVGTHTGADGEFGMGVWIRNGENILIDGCEISYCWGDGIYIGQASNVGTPKKVRIARSNVHHNRRNNMSIISADGMLVTDTCFNFAQGTDPQAGVDIEPNNASGSLSNIEFINCEFAGNVNSGFIINAITLSALGPYLKDVSISVKNSKAYNNNNNYEVAGFINKATGFITFEDCVSVSSGLCGWKIRRMNPDSVKTRLINPQVIDWNRGGNASSTDAGGISGFTLASDPTVAGFGNVEIYDPVFKLNSVIGGTQAEISLRDTSGGKVRNVRITGVKNFTTNTWNVGDKSEWDLKTVSLLLADGVAVGQWIPSYVAYTGPTITSSNANFIRNNESVTITATINFPVNTDTSQVGVSGLPYPTAAIASGLIGSSDFGSLLTWKTDSNFIRCYKADGTSITYAQMSGKTMSFSLTYFTQASGLLN